MNVLLLTQSSGSHIIPIKPLVTELKKKNHIVYCLSTINNKGLIKEVGAKFIEYPFNLVPDQEKNRQAIDMMEKVNQLWQEGKVAQGYDTFIEEDTALMFDVTIEQMLLVQKILKEKKIQLIFRDAVDKLGHYLAQTNQIPEVGYITHNLYSAAFFEQDPNYYYAVFMDAKNRVKKLPENYFADFRKKSDMVYQFYSQKKGNFPLFTHHEFDPMSEYTLIFSTDSLQPKISFEPNRQYQIVFPDFNRFTPEEEIEENLKEFVEQKQTIIYLSSGSLIPQSIHYYFNFIDMFNGNQNKIGFVISCEKFKDELNEYVIEKNKKSAIYIGGYLPQQYLLSNASLFITHGGQNSIIEAIYHQVPIAVTPMTSEQRLNGLMVEFLGIGKTLYQISTKIISIGKVFEELLTSRKIKESLFNCSLEIKNSQNDFTQMWAYIEDEQNRLK